MCILHNAVWQKAHHRDEVMSNSKEIKPIALAIIELHVRLSEGIK